MASKLVLCMPVRRFCLAVSVGELGCGQGKSGGCGGTIRQAGGAFGRLEAAREEKFFYEQNEEMLVNLKHDLEELDNAKNPLKKLTRIQILTTEAEKQRRLIAKGKIN